MERGALLVLEGCDRIGKSTQVKNLVQALNKKGIKAESRVFPDRTTTIGGVISQYLSHQKDLAPESAHLLFSANRWECKTDIIKSLQAGTTLVIDRYAASGAAYSAVYTGRSLAWCKEADRGLPAPDLVALLVSSEEVLASRQGWAEERFERTDFQKKVLTNFMKLKDDSWQIVKGDEPIDQVHEILLEEALRTIDHVKKLPIKELYEK